MKTPRKTEPSTGTPKTRVVIVDDQVPIRAFFQITLGVQPDYEIVAEGRTGTDAVRLCRQFQPDVLILELMLPEMGATAVVEELRAQGAATRSLIFTASRHERALIEAMRARPHGFIHKEESLASLWLRQSDTGADG